MPQDDNPSEVNQSQVAAKDLTAGRDIQIGSIVQTIVNLGLPFNSQHLRFVQFLANSAYLICLIWGFIRLWQNGADLTTMLLLIVGSGLLSLTCLYYAWFWKPEVRDRSTPSSELPDSNELEKAQRTKQRSRQQIRRLAIVGFFLIPLLTCGGFLGWRSIPPPKIIVLVADFDAGNQQKYRITEKFLRNLRDATKTYPDVEVQALGKIITEQQGSDIARAEGERKKATIVIWGWYDVPEDLTIIANFELLRPPAYFPKQSSEATEDTRTLTDGQTLDISELNDFKLPISLKGIPYLTLFTTGMARYAAQDWDRSIERFNDALAQVKPETSASALNQGIVHFYRGVCFYNNSNFPYAIEAYTQAISLNKSGFVESYTNRGNTYIKQGKFDKAIADFNIALNLKSNIAEAYNGRGIAYSNQGKYTQALINFNEAIRLKKDNAEAYNNRGGVYVKQGKYTQALRDFNKVIDLNQDLAAVAYYNRGVVYGEQSDYTQAIANYTKAIELDRDYVEAHQNRGKAYIEQGNFDKALIDLNKAIKLDRNLALNQNLAVAYNNRGRVYVKQGNLIQAIADFNKAIKLNPGDADSYSNLGTVYSNQGEYDRAIIEFTKAIEHKKKFAEAYNKRGIAYFNQGNYTHAITDFNKAIEFKQDFAEAYHNKASVYYNKACAYSLKREVKVAIESLKQAINLDAKLRENAKTDSDFDNIRKDKQFQTLVGK